MSFFCISVLYLSDNVNLAVKAAAKTMSKVPKWLEIDRSRDHGPYYCNLGHLSAHLKKHCNFMHKLTKRQGSVGGRCHGVPFHNWISMKQHVIDKHEFSWCCCDVLVFKYTCLQTLQHLRLLAMAVFTAALEYHYYLWSFCPSFCKQDNWRMRKRTSTKLGRHGQGVTL